MENFKVLKLLCFTEKLSNIHRDYLCLSRRKRVIVLFLILLEIIISALLCIAIYYLVIESISRFGSLGNAGRIYISLLFYVLYLIHSILILTYYCPRFGIEFISLIKILSHSHEVLKIHAPYNKFLLQLRKRVLVALAVTTAFKVAIVAHALLSVYRYKDLMPNIFLYICYYTMEIWCEFRYTLSILMYYSLLSIVRYMLQGLILLIKEAEIQGSLEDHINRFAGIYCQLLESSKLVKKCFGYQILFSLFMAATHMVFLVYYYLNMALKLQIFNAADYNFCLNIISYCGLFMVISMSGQKVRNEVLNLKLVLAQILYQYTTELPVQKRLKDFHRLVSVEPLLVSLLPALPVGMYLVPAVVSFTTNYIIVSLQMNHDI